MEVQVRTLAVRGEETGREDLKIHTHPQATHRLPPFQPSVILDRVDTIDQSNGLCHKIKRRPTKNHSSPSILNLPLLQTPVITRKCGMWL